MQAPESSFLCLHLGVRLCLYQQSCPLDIFHVSTKSIVPLLFFYQRGVRKKGEERWLCAPTHSARSGEVGALYHTLPHLAAEQANTHTLEVLRGDLQTYSMPLELCG